MSWFLESQKKVSIDPKIIEEILERGVHSIWPDKKSFQELLFSGKRIRCFFGIDATGSEIHLGHVTKLLVLDKLRSLGHEAILLFGDFTAQIGDPTDKEAVRIRLTQKQVEENIKNWKDQVKKIINLNGENPIKIVKNSFWLASLNFTDLIELASNFTVQQMIERDMFEKRIEQGKPVYLHEFFYPLMQGYDSVALDVDLEMGGSDQIFNMLAGRTLLKKIKNKEKFVLALNLLENPNTGKKLMSKSAGDYIPVSDTPQNIYGKVMSLPDEVVPQMILECTKIDWQEAKDFVRKIKEQTIHPKEAKMKLAWEVVKMCHSEKEADLAFQSFNLVFKDGTVPENIQTLEVEEKTSFSDAIEKTGLIKSKSEVRRLIQSGAIEEILTRQKINKIDFILNKEIVLRIGKKKFIKFKIRKKK